MIAVISTPGARPDHPANCFLLPATFILEGKDCTYFFYQLTNEKDLSTPDFSMPDLDGTPMIVYRTFPTMDDAKAWVTKDAHQRWLMLSAKGSAQ